MSTPVPDFRPGTRIWGQAATGAPTIGFIMGRGASAGKANILLFAPADGAASIVTDADFYREDQALPTGAKAFKLNNVTP